MGMVDVAASSVFNQLFEDKYCPKYMGRSEALTKVAKRLSSNSQEERRFDDILQRGFFYPGGRVLAAFAAERNTTPYNCFVSETIDDSMEGIMRAVGRAAQVLRRGGGIGYDFSTIRYRGAPIKSFDTSASGPLSFISVFEHMARTVTSAGERRGAQMGVMRIDHPDIEDFIQAKCCEPSPFRMFNFSVGVTDAFIVALREKKKFPLKWNGEVIREVDAVGLWKLIMDCTWDWSDPGTLFLDRINEWNNLYYCERIAATNPCGEQPLPPNGACLLGSLNLAAFVTDGEYIDQKDIADVTQDAVMLLNRVIDLALYPLQEHKDEMLSKRRIGIGVMGLANAGERVGGPYASPKFLQWEDKTFSTIRDAAYETSIEMARRLRPFPLWHREHYSEGKYVKTLPTHIRADLHKHGIRNSHLISIAPTGTISFIAGNVSSGIEPVFAKEYERKVLMTGDKEPRTIVMKDYGWDKWKQEPKTAMQLTPREHLEVVAVAQKYVDSGISKTCNIGAKVTRKQFEQVYMDAYDLGMKGCTTYRPGGKREGAILQEIPSAEGGSCYIDAQTGAKSCGE